jgi:hypothetical protein
MPGREQDAQEAKAGTSKGDRKPARDGCSSTRPGWITGRIPGLVPGRESALTWAGEPVQTSCRNPSGT